VLILTYSDAEEVVVGAIRAGASGYLVHGRFEPDELIDAVHDVAAGRTVLCPTIAPVVFDARRSQPERTAANAAAGITARERDVMTRIATGMSNRVIAAKVFLSENTVKNHVNDVYGKLRVRSRAEAIALWLSATDTNHDGL
jgi:DNA-binding NarL/FixJ family response regulator